MSDNRTTELATIIEALTALASAITWTVPNSAPSVESHLKNAWTAIDELNAALGEQSAKSGADALSRRARDMAQNIQGNLGRCLYRRKDVAEMEEVSEMLMELANELDAALSVGGCAKCAEDMGAYADSLCDPIKERLDGLLRCLATDWHISASWDGLRKFWCIELTEEGVRDGINPDGLPNGLTLSDDGTLLDWRGENYVKQSTLGGVCENVSDPPEGFLCSKCGWGDFAEPSHLLTSAKYTGRVHGGPNYCPNCGGKVER